MAQKPTTLSLHSDEPGAPRRRGRIAFVSLAALLLVLLATLGFFGFLGYEVLRRTEAVERELTRLSARMDQAEAVSRQSADRATAAEVSATAAAQARQQAEAQTTLAREEATSARVQTASALEAAAQAQVEADRIRKQAEADVNRLQEALGQVAETRRTALGLVMNLGSDYLKFEFDKAELRPEDRELLSRIAGILDDVAGLHRLRQRAHRRRGHGGVQPEALRAPRPSGARLPGEGRAAAGAS